MIVLGCDPGTTESSFVIWDGARVMHSIELDNESAAKWLRTRSSSAVFVIEQIESMGMAVGREVFETVFWTGRFVEAVNMEWHRVTRRQVKLHLCGSMKAKDANIRQALLDKLGPVGTSKNPGPLYGISKHKWSALAVAVTYLDTREGYRLPEPTAKTTTEEF